MSSVWPYHFVCGVVLLLVSRGFFLVLSFYILRVLGIGCGKREVDGAWGEMCGIGPR